MMSNAGLVFRHKLALALGKTVAEIDEMSQSELTDWHIYDRLFCLPDPSYLAGLICAAIGNFAGKSAKDHLVSTDFLPISQTRANKIKAEKDKAEALRMAQQARVRMMNQEISAARKAARK